MAKHIGFRSVHGDLTSSHGYRWPWPGKIATAPGPIIESHKGPCPSVIGDGICIAKDFYGAASGGIPAITCLIVEWSDKDVLGEDEHKVRVKRAKVLEVIDLPLLIVAGFMVAPADLSYADLSYANLRYANLRSADLRYANLSYADLSYADLRSADLRYANLSYADLRYANLRYALTNKWTRLPSGIVIPKVA